MTKKYLFHSIKIVKYYFYHYLYDSIKRFIQDKYSYRASALTYTTLLSIVPLLLSIFSIVAIFPIFEDIHQTAQNYIFDNFIPSSATTIQNYLQTFIQQATKLSIVSILFLFFSAYLLLITIEETFNEIWKVSQSKVWYVSVLNFFMLLFSPFLISLIIFLVTSLLSLPSLIGLNNTRFIFISHLFIPIVVNTIIFSGILIAIPNTKVPYQAGIIGGCVAAILLEVTRYILAYYMEKFSTYSLIYGGFAIIPIFLIWLYLFWCIILFSAEISYRYTQK